MSSIANARKALPKLDRSQVYTTLCSNQLALLIDPRPVVMAEKQPERAVEVHIGVEQSKRSAITMAKMVCRTMHWETHS